MPEYVVTLKRTISYTALIEAPSAASAAHKFGEQVRANPDTQSVSDVISEVRAVQTDGEDD